MGTRVLIIEDDAGIREGVKAALGFAGFDAFEALRGDTGLELALTLECDLVLLDLVLPVRDGLDVLRGIRASRPELPVIILTAKGRESERVAGLQAGADDYVVKPFGVKELLARIEAVLRRSPGRTAAVTELSIPEGVADLRRRELRFTDGARVELTEREAELLCALARNPGRVMAREELLRSVWHLDPRGLETRTIDMLVMRLREKLRDKRAEPQVLITVRGKGYMLGRLEARP